MLFFKYDSYGSLIQSNTTDTIAKGSFKANSAFFVFPQVTTIASAINDYYCLISFKRSDGVEIGSLATTPDTYTYSNTNNVGFKYIFANKNVTAVAGALKITAKLYNRSNDSIVASVSYDLSVTDNSVAPVVDVTITEEQYEALIGIINESVHLVYTPYWNGTELCFSNNGDLENPNPVDLKGVSVDNFTKISTSGLTDTYRLSLDDGTYYDIPIKNGKSITKIEKIGTAGVVDTYCIFYNDGTVWDFDVTNGVDGVSIDTITKTASVGNVDTYTITLSDSSTTTFEVVNGIDGADGNSAGFGSPNITVNMLEPGATPTASVGASGPDTAKVFSFVLNIPKGDTGQSTQWYFGSGSPANDLGNVSDVYCNQTNYDVYLKTGEATWKLKGNIKGETGRGIDHIAMTGHNVGTNTDRYTIYYTDGTTSEYGVNGGIVWFNGNGSPSSNFGNVGDYYLNNNNGDVYKRTSGSAWTYQCNINGAKGDTGPSMLMDMPRDPTSNASDYPENNGVVVDGAYWFNTTDGSIWKFNKSTYLWESIYREIIDFPSDLNALVIDTTSSNCVFDSTATILSQRIYIDTRAKMLHVSISIYGDIDSNYDNSSLGIIGKIKYLQNFGYQPINNVKFDGSDYAFLTQAISTDQSMANVKYNDVLFEKDGYNNLIIKLGTYNNAFIPSQNMNLIISCDIPIEKI